MSDIFSVDGMVAVITGGGTGIGLMMASTLENNGATVYIIGRRLEVLEKAAREHNKYGRIIPLQGDITDRERVLGLVEQIKAEHGYIDLLVNNAGIALNLLPHPLPEPDAPSFDSPPSPPSSPTPLLTPSIKSLQSALWNSGSPDDFSATFATNVTSIYYTTVAFLDLLHQGNIRQYLSPIPHPYRPPHHSSQVITVSSSGAFRYDAKILSVSYTLAKAATTHLGKVLANILAPWGIRSNVFAPGVWPTDMTSTGKLNPYALAAAVPLKRAGSEEDITGIMLFLASRAGAYANGGVFLIDGGRVQGLVSPL